MATNNLPTPKNNSLVPKVDKLTGLVYKVSSEGLLLLSSQDSLNVFENAFSQVRQYLRHFATEPDFLSKIQTAFGENNFMPNLINQ